MFNILKVSVEIFKYKIYKSKFVIIWRKNMNNWFKTVIDVVRGNQNAVVIPMDMGSDNNKKGVLTSPEWVYSPMFGSPRRIDYAELEEYENNTYVQSAINYIIDSVSGMDYTIVDDTESDIDTKEVESFFNATNWDKSFKAVLRSFISDTLLYDAGVLVLSYPNHCYDEQNNLIRTDKPISMAAYDGRSFIKDVNINGDIKAYYQYSFLSQAQRPVQFAPDEIIYMQEHPSSRSPYGISKLNTIKDVADYLTAVARSHRSGMENGLSPGGVIKHPSVSDPERLKQLSAMYNSKLSGENNAKKWIVSGGDAEFTPISTTSNVDATWVEGSEFYLHTILSIFKVSASVLGFPGDVNRATSETLQQSFKTNGVGVMVSLIEEYLTREVVKKHFNESLSFKFVSEIDLNDEMLRSEIDTKNIQAGLVTVDELRVRDGKDPMPVVETIPIEIEDTEKSINGEDFEQIAVDLILELNKENEIAVLRELEELYGSKVDNIDN
jgi:HK97 family phage portal protein